MICYMDRTFCINPNCTCPEGRKLTPDVEVAAAIWWGGPDAPISVADICGSQTTFRKNPYSSVPT